MLLKEITDYLESLAPLSTQESYDNSGLIVGDPGKEVTGALVSLDCTEAIVQEAIDKGVNLIVAHHPIIFKGLKKITGKTYVERTIIMAIKNDIAIYAIHTNFDNYKYGVNAEIGQRLGLNNIAVLAPMESSLVKLVCFVPEVNTSDVLKAMFECGAGEIGNYKNCSYRSLGIGTFQPEEGAEPFEGEIGRLSEVKENRVEVLVRKEALQSVLFAMKAAHPYEEVAYEAYELLNLNQDQGAGMIGELPEEMYTSEFIALVKKIFNCGVIRHSSLIDDKVRKIAFCGGSGSFLLDKAIKNKADVYLSADFKYHEFFDADEKIVILDIGHYESEQFTSNRLADVLKKKFATFAVHLTEVNTNPINYY